MKIFIPLRGIVSIKKNDSNRITEFKEYSVPVHRTISGFNVSEMGERCFFEGKRIQGEVGVIISLISLAFREPCKIDQSHVQEVPILYRREGCFRFQGIGE